MSQLQDYESSNEDYESSSEDYEDYEWYNTISATSPAGEPERKAIALSEPCRVCETTIFDAIFFPEQHVPQGGVHSTFYEPDFSFSNCDTCNLFGAVTPKQNRSFEVRLFDAAKEAFLNNRRRYLQPTLVLTTIATLTFGKIPYEPCGDLCHDRGFMFAKTRGSGNHGQKQFAKAPHVDLS